MFELLTASSAEVSSSGKIHRLLIMDFLCDYLGGSDGDASEIVNTHHFLSHSLTRFVRQFIS